MTGEEREEGRMNDPHSGSCLGTGWIAVPSTHSKAEQALELGVECSSGQVDLRCPWGAGEERSSALRYFL